MGRMMRFFSLLVAAIALTAFGYPQELRGSVVEVPQPQQLMEYNDPKPAVKTTVTHAPAHWVGAGDITTPGLAWLTLLGMPLVLIPCMVKCKNGNLDKLF